MKKYIHEDEVVEAAEITCIDQHRMETIKVVAGTEYNFNMAWTIKNKPEIGGFIVKHKDGISYMPNQTFTGLYKEI